MSKRDAELDRVEAAVLRRYSAGAAARQAALCCPTAYDSRYLTVIPQEVLDRDYGCGDPSAHLRTGETVLDLGSGSGKVCFIASQVVGPQGRVIGVDMNDDMLALARRSVPVVAEKVGYANVEFRKGRIQDLALDIDKLSACLEADPVLGVADIERLANTTSRLRREAPLVPDDSVDVVISNCVLNLVRVADKRTLFSEIHRVLRRGGRAVISDIVSDEDVPAALQADTELWSGCISGAMREDEFLRAFEDAGFYGITLLERKKEPWQTIEGIEFRSVTVAAYKGKEGACLDQKQAVIYRGPFRQVEDDDGHVLRRGVRTAVCGKTFAIYSKPPYRDQFDLLPPRTEVPQQEAPPFPCGKGTIVRHPRENKGQDYRRTDAAAKCAPKNGSGACC